MAGALGVWAFGLASRFYSARNFFGVKLLWRKALRLDLIAMWLPIMLFLGGVRASVFLFLIIYVEALFRWLSRYQQRKYTEMQLSKRIYLAQPHEGVDLALVFPAGFELLISVVIVLLYVPVHASEAFDAFMNFIAGIVTVVARVLGQRSLPSLR